MTKSDQEIRYMKAEEISAEYQIKLQYCNRCTGKTSKECDHKYCDPNGSGREDK